MDKHNFVLTLVTTLAMLSICAGGSFAQNTLRKDYGKWHRGAFGVKGGVLNAGTIRLDDMKYETNVGFTGGVYFEIPLGSRLLYSLSADLHDIQALNERQAALEMGFSLKVPIYKPNSRLAMKPGFMVGFAYLGQMDELDPSRYLTFKVFFEVIFYTDQKYAWVGEFGVFGSPSGGNDDYDITFGPTVMVRGGVLY